MHTKGDSMKQFQRLIVYVILMAFMLSVLSSCNENGQTTEERPISPVTMIDNGEGSSITFSDICGYTVQAWNLPDICPVLTSHSFRVQGDTVQFLSDTDTGDTVLVVMNTDGEALQSFPLPMDEDAAVTSIYPTDAELHADDSLFWLSTADGSGKRFLRHYGDADSSTPLAEIRTTPPAEEMLNNQSTPNIPAKLRIVYTGSDRRADQTRILVLEEQRLTVYDYDLQRLAVLALPTCNASGSPLNSDMVFETAVMVTDSICMLGYQMTDACFVDLAALQITEKPDSMRLPEDVRYMTCYPSEDALFYLTEEGLFRGSPATTDAPMQLRFLDGILADYPDTVLGIFSDGSVLIREFDYFENTLAFKRIVPTQSTGPLSRKVITLSSLQFGRLLGNQMRVIEDSEWMAQAIAAFNAENEAYYIEVLPSYYERAADRGGNTSVLDILKEDLFAGEVADLVLFDSYESSLIPYLEKDAFLDLQSVYADTLLPAVETAFSINEHLYLLPLSFHINTFLTNQAEIAADTPLTMQRFYEIAEMLPADTVMTASESAIDRITANEIMSFVDRENKTCSFDSPGFCDFIRFSEQFNESYVNAEYGTVSNNGDWIYRISTPGITENLQSGKQMFLEFPMNTVNGYTAAKLLYGEDFTICGYPSSKGCGAEIRSDVLLAVNADSAVLGGVKQFLDFVLSEQMQTSMALLSSGLPVVRDAFVSAMDMFTYQYYYEPLFLFSDRYSNLGMMQYVGASETSLKDTKYKDTEWATYHEVVFTEEDKAALLAFLDTCRMQANTDTVITSIVNEELSAWREGVRSLEDAAKIIDSRVWIYLNE